MRRRVVVTGLGMVSALGNTVEDSWQALKEGKSGIQKITKFDTTGYPVHIAGEVKNLDTSLYMDDRDARKMAFFSHYAVAAAVQAYRQSGLENSSYDKERSGVCLGIGIGGFEEFEAAAKKLFEKGPNAIAPLFIPKLISNEGAGNVAMRLGWKGPSVVMNTACASGTDAITIAADMIRAGRAEVMIAGGAEAAITAISIAGFAKLTALTTDHADHPEKASRPFDKERSGFVMGEGAGILILEEYEHAIARGADIICEYAGGAMTCDAYHLTSPTPDGSGAAEAFRLALIDSGLQPTDIGYINAHGTSTPVNDPSETKAIKQAFGEHAWKLKISSTKSMHAHCLGAAGGIEAVIAIKALTENFVPPTINLDNPDPDCDLDYVPNVGQSVELQAVMSDSLGFGGHNGVVCFKKFQK
ncbi:beta-ketoacyl-ACP synthase II [Entomospira nematocerorum]|uniref:3-oxoacyl-[acyl-carrier-protein] synthase 2 n=1 Tax=Entomospira nematocerorum TaxID=2719987 RepID=A0A968KYA3_9SPIO|nr:beta-ketoacyl-ACP synthase II [Entomospira nematocera]NIZ47372.1 beta-ketoacyl-ACP synthase II [Entomospira nematocera]WDI34087.1 beta-ketoacyl-ACP synthase II [Entomospira nematocera]